eukprot:1156678-Pelagomonas_calceolata.AAC.4
MDPGAPACKATPMHDASMQQQQQQQRPPINYYHDPPCSDATRGGVEPKISMDPDASACLATSACGASMAIELDKVDD